MLNGTKAAASFKRHFGDLAIPHAEVRSSSPVPAKSGNSLEEKTTLWREALDKAHINLSGGSLQ